MRVMHHTFRVLQMAAAVGHNHGGTLWGALTDGADRWRFYHMERAVEYPCDEVRARTWGQWSVFHADSVTDPRCAPPVYVGSV
jgi:hypothetical protein